MRGHNAQEQASAWFGRVFNQLLACVDDPQTGAKVFDAAELALSDARPRKSILSAITLSMAKPRAAGRVASSILLGTQKLMG